MDAKIDMQFYYTIWFGLQHLYDAWAKRHGMTSHAMFVLYTIAREKGICTQKQICEKLLLPKQTVHTILNGFEEKGWLERQVMETDKRNKRLLLTQQGKEYAEAVLGNLSRREEAAMLQMSYEERRAMSENNRRFFENLRKTMECPD